MTVTRRFHWHTRRAYIADRIPAINIPRSSETCRLEGENIIKKNKTGIFSPTNRGPGPKSSYKTQGRYRSDTTLTTSVNHRTQIVNRVMARLSFLLLSAAALAAVAFASPLNNDKQQVTIFSNCFRPFNLRRISS